MVCLIDTREPSPRQGGGARHRQAIAEPHGDVAAAVPICCVVLVKGAAAALWQRVGDRLGMFEHAYYSVITPEGCAAIRWRARAGIGCGGGPEADHRDLRS